MKKIIFIIFLFFCSSNIFSAQPAFHCLSGHFLNKAIDTEFNCDPWMSAPIAGISSHMLADRFVSEGSLDYQIELGLIRIAIMWMATPDKDKDLFLWESFWSILPDIISQTCKTDYHHFYTGDGIILFNNATNLGEEFSILLFEMKIQ